MFAVTQPTPVVRVMRRCLSVTTKAWAEMRRRDDDVTTPGLIAVWR